MEALNNEIARLTTENPEDQQTEEGATKKLPQQQSPKALV